ncbi:MAG: hypothetical protein Q4D16_10370 [Eubacteriales bacterium]|nr:hypothetical protein [Eubacteriales bacterium]
MKKILKIEVKKALTGVRFKTAFLTAQFLGILSLVSVFRQYQIQKDYIMYWADSFPVRQVYTLYHSWILNEPVSIGRTVFFLCFPLLAAFPFAASYYQEEKKKQLRLVLINVKVSEYFCAKYIAVFISGMLVIVGCLCMNFALTAAVFPWENPLAFYPYFNVLGNEMWSGLFYGSPFIYVIGYIFIEGIYGGLFACSVYVLSMYIKKQLVFFGGVMFAYLGCDVVRGGLRQWFPQFNIPYEFSPLGFLRGSGYRRNGYMILGIALMILLLQCAFIVKRSKRYEIY